MMFGNGIGNVQAFPARPARAQADKACQPFDQGVDVVIGFAKKSGSQLVVVPHAQMQAFIAGLGDRGKGIIGDSALVLMGPDVGPGNDIEPLMHEAAPGESVLVCRTATAAFPMIRTRWPRSQPRFSPIHMPGGPRRRKPVS